MYVFIHRGAIMNSQNQNTKLNLSYELLLLLKWLITHEEQKFRQIINKALKHGLKSQIEKTLTHDDLADDLKKQPETQIIEFFHTLEDFLYDSIASNTKKNKTVHLDTFVHQIDSLAKQDDLMIDTMNSTFKTLDKDPYANAKETLMKEFIKKWKPVDEIMH